MTGSSQHPRAGFAGVLHARIAGGHPRDFHAIVEAVLTGGYDRLACTQAMVDQRSAVECFADGDWADPHGTIWLRYENIGTALPLQHCAQWHGDAVMTLGQDKVDIHELAGP